MRRLRRPLKLGQNYHPRGLRKKKKTFSSACSGTSSTSCACATRPSCAFSCVLAAFTKNGYVSSPIRRPDESGGVNSALSFVWLNSKRSRVGDVMQSGSAAYRKMGQGVAPWGAYCLRDMQVAPLTILVVDHSEATSMWPAEPGVPQLLECVALSVGYSSATCTGRLRRYTQCSIRQRLLGTWLWMFCGPPMILVAWLLAL